jgi:hypothetical protein
MGFRKDVIPGLAGHAWGCLLDGYILDIGPPKTTKELWSSGSSLEAIILPGSWRLAGR